MKFDQYEIKARVIPSVITTMLPLFLFNYFLVNQELQKLFATLSEWEVVSGVTTSLILLYFIVEINRGLSKYLFEKYFFKGTSHLPTTTFLLFGDTEYSHDFKARLRNKIESNFGIKLLSKEDEEKDQNLARKLIAESVSHIRNKMRKDEFIKQANIRYGFFRNLIGGCVIGATLSIANIAYLLSNDLAHWTLITNSVLLGIYILFLLLSGLIIGAHGKSYARTLLENYDYSNKQ